MRLALFALFISFLPFGPPAIALDCSLQTDLGVRGLYHLCRYRNGQVYSFNATELCPLSVSDNVSSPNRNAPSQKMGMKIGEYEDGMTKVCIYDVLGEKAAIRISAVGLCPLSHHF